jgi:hypothetical protein
VPIWRDLEQAAPEIVERGLERLGAGVALLGTLRKDGSPRISPIEPFVVEGELVFGAMSWSLKAADLRRDPRCILHSAVSDPEGSEGELKLYGQAEAARRDLREAAKDAWWAGRPVGDAHVFALRIERAVFVSWDAAAGTVVFRRWSPERGFSVLERPYP